MCTLLSHLHQTIQILHFQELRIDLLQAVSCDFQANARIHLSQSSLLHSSAYQGMKDEAHGLSNLRSPSIMPSSLSALFLVWAVDGGLTFWTLIIGMQGFTDSSDCHWASLICPHWSYQIFCALDGMLHFYIICHVDSNFPFLVGPSSPNHTFGHLVGQHALY